MPFLFFINPFTLPGQQFLLFYSICFFLLYALLMYVIRRIDSSRQLSLPKVSGDGLDPFEFATLRGGANELVRLYLFQLISNDLIRFDKGADGKISKDCKLRRTGKPLEQVPELTPKYQAFLDYFEHPKSAQDVFQCSPLEVAAKDRARRYDNKLHEDRFLLSDTERTSTRRWLFAVLALFLLIGTTKIIVAVATAHWNIGFLIVGMGIGSIIYHHDFKPSKVNDLGRRYIETLQIRFRSAPNGMKGEFSEGKSVRNMLLPIAVLGAPVLAGTMFDDFSSIFRPGHSSDGGCGGGCSGGCGDGCGGCGGCGD